ncbi:uncharacterized protein Z519_01783 [Cladophialophora bantiana CBS 173.52]|uniref:Calmodulin n=1 Tax=Cladophialophora bantiana (strain ATCC 10958 / CBS 173.52 / CDC B-1940 / NIH 8579) TaxID=1442370 RepID=A0A0D2IN29_CLAB1|nr:uncharacterized protein Z519_01783 [Cladophialophora bantiana CBS 173.52]KIW98199.1 hypothetical protein Z519_01783 [Cladophialophora bantiana CBS 173.52]
MSDEEVKAYKDVFALFDKDGSGTITAHELGEIMKSLGQNPSDSELQDMVRSPMSLVAKVGMDFGQPINPSHCRSTRSTSIAPAA